jgi:hypothetical protein
LEYASEHERNFGGGLDEHALEQHEPMAAERRPVGGTGPYVPPYTLVGSKLIREACLTCLAL